MTENQKTVALSSAAVSLVALYAYTHVKQSRATKRLEKKTDMLLKLNNFINPDLIK